MKPRTFALTALFTLASLTVAACHDDHPGSWGRHGRGDGGQGQGQSQGSNHGGRDGNGGR